LDHLSTLENKNIFIIKEAYNKFLKIAVIGIIIVAGTIGVIWLYLLGTEPSETANKSVSFNNNYRDITVDGSVVIGRIKSLQGVNAGPSTPKGKELTEEYKDLGVNYVRIHDFYGPGDINTIFPNFSEDTHLGENFNFGPTDKIIKAIKDMGAEVFFRLGYSWDGPNAPPEDFKKWANICKHIVMHYNDGWANGFHYNIKYWEIWNEPDVRKFWTGTPEQFYQLFEIVAKTLKAYDPSLMVGGPGGSRSPVPEYNDYFLAYLKNNDVPLDFFSWHGYSPLPGSLVRLAQRQRELLNREGFSSTKSIITEWRISGSKGSSLPKKRTQLRKLVGDTEANEIEWIDNVFSKLNLRGRGRAFKHTINAPFIASCLINLQDTDVDIAIFYRGDYHPWGLFDVNSGYTKPAYAFKAMNMMLSTPLRLATTGFDNYGYATMAGKSQDNKKVTILISNIFSSYTGYNLRVKNLPWDSKPFIFERYVIDEKHNLSLVESGDFSEINSFTRSVSMKPPSVQLIILKKRKD
jgi:hypothetical protein